MSIIIQQFIQPIVSGVMFIYNITKPEIYIEYYDGYNKIEEGKVKKPYTIVIKKDFLIENTDEFYLIYILLKDVYPKILEFKKEFNKSDIEFIIDNNLKMRLVQLRKMTYKFSINNVIINTNLKTIDTNITPDNNKIKNIAKAELRKSKINLNITNNLFNVGNLYKIKKIIEKKIKNIKFLDIFKKNIENAFDLDLNYKNILLLNSKFAFYDIIIDIINQIRRLYDSTTEIISKKINNKNNFNDIKQTLNRFLRIKPIILNKSQDRKISEIITNYEFIKIK